MIGNRESVSSWKNNWIPSNGGLRKPMSPILNLGLNVKDLWDDNGEWDEYLIRNTFSETRDVDNILEIYIPSEQRNDNKVCGLSLKMVPSQLNPLIGF